MTRLAKCSAKCRGWDVFETNTPRGVELEACGECNSYKRDAGQSILTDHDVEQLPEARRKLERAITRGPLAGALCAALRDYECEYCDRRLRCAPDLNMWLARDQNGNIVPCRGGELHEPDIYRPHRGGYL